MKAAAPDLGWASLIPHRSAITHHPGRGQPPVVAFGRRLLQWHPLQQTTAAHRCRHISTAAAFGKQWYWRRRKGGSAGGRRGLTSRSAEGMLDSIMFLLTTLIPRSPLMQTLQSLLLLLRPIHPPPASAGGGVANGRAEDLLLSCLPPLLRWQWQQQRQRQQQQQRRKKRNLTGRWTIGKSLFLKFGYFLAAIATALAFLVLFGRLS